MVVYCLEARDFERMIGAHTEVASYFEATWSVRGRPAGAGSRSTGLLMAYKLLVMAQQR